MTFKHTYLIAFMICIGAITYQDVKNCQDMPWPPRIIATGIVFGILDLFSIISEELAAVIALGIVLGFGMNSLPIKGVALPGFGPHCDHPCQGTAQVDPNSGTGFAIGGGIPLPTIGPGTTTPGAGPLT